MRLYLLERSDWYGERFAQTSLAEPHPWLNPDEVCRACYEPENRRRRGPYTIRWQSGSDEIPDFIFGGAAWEFLVTDRVKVAFETAGLKGYVAWPVKVEAPAKREARKRPIVQWPYKGPPLWDIYVDTFVHIIPEASDVRYKGPCGVCGRERYAPVGDDDSYVVDCSSWDGSDFMRPHELRGPIVTERVVEVIEREGFTNVQWSAWGEIGDRGTADLTRMRTDITPTKTPEPEPDATEGMPPSSPPLSDKLTARHAEFLGKLVDYVRMEENDEDLTAADLTFLRSAQVEDGQYWLWRYEDAGGSLCYATVSKDAKGRLCLGCNAADGQTPEQHMWAAHKGWL